MAEPTTTPPVLEQLGCELVEASRRAARATVLHEQAKAAFDATRVELEEAEIARTGLQNRIERLTAREARGQSLEDALVNEIPF
jgi:hypothetical protein